MLIYHKLKLSFVIVYLTHPITVHRWVFRHIKAKFTMLSAFSNSKMWSGEELSEDNGGFTSGQDSGDMSSYTGSKKGRPKPGNLQFHFFLTLPILGISSMYS